MDRIDEAVEVALCVRPFAEAKTSGRSMWELIDTATEEDAEVAMRAALLAGVKVLLGEPVAWMFRAGPECAWQVARSEDEAAASKDVYVRADCLQAEYTAIYAPSLGEGDGR